MTQQLVNLAIANDPDTPPQILEAFRSRVRPETPQPERVTLRWTQREIDRAIQIATPALSQARAKAQMLTSMHNMLRIMVGFNVYAQQNKSVWPDALGQIVETECIDAIPRSPLQPDNPNAYVYIKPGDKPAGDTVVLYERIDPKLGLKATLLVGFADGHVEALADDAVLPEAHRKKD